MHTARTRDHDTDDEGQHRSSHPIRGLIDDIELNSLINASSDTNTRDFINNEKTGARDHLLLKCRDAIEELYQEIAEERGEKQ